MFLGLQHYTYYIHINYNVISYNSHFIKYNFFKKQKYFTLSYATIQKFPIEQSTIIAANIMEEM